MNEPTVAKAMGRDRRSASASAVLCAVLCAATLHAADWPQFLGPERNGKSPETGLARSWPKDGPKLLWRVPLGPGYGGAAVKDGKVYVLDRVPAKEVLRCLDLQTGNELWSFSCDAPGKVMPDGSRSTPTVDDKRVYMVGSFGHFHCVDRDTHQVVWQCHLVNDFAGRLLKWGHAHGPLLYKDTVILAPQGRDAGLAAFDKTSGRVVWKSPYVPGMISQTWTGSYVSPQLLTVGGVEQVVFVTAVDLDVAKKAAAPGQLFGVSAQDGALLWSYQGWQCALPIASPAPLPDGRVFLTGAYDGGSALVKVEKTEKGFAAKELFKSAAAGSQIQQAIVYDGHAYIVSNGKERREGLLCMSLDGEVKWHTTNSTFCSKAKDGLPNFDVGNAVYADGMLYVMDGKTGDLRLIGASPEGYKELACAPAVLSGKQMWAPMALSDGKLLLRDHTQMKCLDVRGK